MVEFDKSVVREVKDLLDTCHQCRIFPGAATQWDSTNSRVVSLPAIDLAKLFPKASQHNVACNLVSISGETDECLHTHTSHVIGLVVRGEGRLRHRKSDGPEELISNAKSGDLMIIPRGVEHLFDTPEGEEIEWIALEISDLPIDYQKHYTE